MASVETTLGDVSARQESLRAENDRLAAENEEMAHELEFGTAKLREELQTAEERATGLEGEREALAKKYREKKEQLAKHRAKLAKLQASVRCVVVSVWIDKAAKLTVRVPLSCLGSSLEEDLRAARSERDMAVEEVGMQRERAQEELTRSLEELQASRDALRKAKKAHGATGE
jgi:predicted  nucleic acid-binding Zn-ribbon protein